MTLNYLPTEINESTDANGNWSEAWSPVLSALSHFEPQQIDSLQHQLQRKYNATGLAQSLIHV